MVELIWDDIKVQWVALGEGNSGEYNPEDPNDEELLRFDVMKLEEPSRMAICSEDSHWEQIDDASYCTQTPADTSPEVLTRLALIIMSNVFDHAHAGMSIKKRCEELSYIHPGWLEGRK